MQASARSRGGPLLMLALLLAGWCGLRVALWEYPFAPPALAGAAPLLRAVRPAPHLPRPVGTLHRAGSAALIQGQPQPDPDGRAVPLRLTAPHLAASAALPGLTPFFVPQAIAAPTPDAAAALPVSVPPFLPQPPAVPIAARLGRWSLDGWAFWRQGSSSAPVSQGRVPIYGASQTGAVLQYRLAPSSRHDPRLYARAYRALVRRGENEAALGASLRPLGGVPLRLAGEVRYTDAAFFNDVRPAAYVVTELPLLRLPHGFRAEAYGQGAGWAAPERRGLPTGRRA